MLKNRTARYALILAGLVVCIAILIASASQLQRSPAKAREGGSAKKEPAPSPAPSISAPVTTAELKLDNPDGIPGLAESKTEVYAVPKRQTLSSVAHAYLSKTVFLTTDELEGALCQANKLPKETQWMKQGQQLVIPGILAQPVVEHSVPQPREFEVHAIYMTGRMAGSEHGVQLARQWRQAGGNSVVFDAKDSDGSVNIPFADPLTQKREHYFIPSLPKYVHYLHSLGLHAIARIALFRDQELVGNHPDLAVHSRSSKQPWRENGKLVWTDPSLPAVQDYNLALAKEAVSSGVDEVQFDYVRFPAEGNQKDALFHFESAHPKWQRTDVITDFLARAYAELHPTGVLFSLDVFGVMAWERKVDLSHTGQDIPSMAKNCDVLSPMIYPSHFFGMDGYTDPGDAPEHFISESMARYREVTAGTKVVLRPWLQAFGWRTKSYSPEYILTQVRVAREEGGDGFLFWNARNDYAKPFKAMPTILANKDKYLGVLKIAENARPAAPGNSAAKETQSAPANPAPTEASSPATTTRGQP